MKTALIGAVAVVTSLAFTTPSWAADSGITEITNASFGYVGERVDAKEAVKKLCIGKSSCKVLVTAENLGVADPSPGNDKAMITGWKCAGSDTVHRDQLPGGKTWELKCP